MQNKKAEKTAFFQYWKKLFFSFDDIGSSGIFRVFAIGFAGNFLHFLLCKLVIINKFCKSLVIISGFIKEIGGNAIGFSVFDLIGEKRKVISGAGFAFRVDSVAVIGVESNLVAFCENIPFAVVSENVELKNVVEGKAFLAFVLPEAADASFVIEIIVVLSIKSYFFHCFGIKRFRFLKLLAAGKKKDETKKNKNYFFQSNCALSYSYKSIK